MLSPSVLSSEEVLEGVAVARLEDGLPLGERHVRLKLARAGVHSYHKTTFVPPGSFDLSTAAPTRFLPPSTRSDMGTGLMHSAPFHDMFM